MPKLQRYFLYGWSCLLGFSLGIVSSCGEDRPTYKEPDITIDNRFDDLYNREDLCGTSEGYSRHECRLPEYQYEVVRNERIGERREDRYTDGTYYILWSKKGYEYRWEVDFVPVDGHTSRQMRFVIDEDELPKGIIELNVQPRSNGSASFHVDVSKIYEDKNDKQWCYIEDAEKHEDAFKQKDDLEGGDNCTTLQKWLKKKDNKEGEIPVDIQDISYCYLQNRINKDVASNQVDCSDPGIGTSYYRTSTLYVPYVLDHDGAASSLFCSFTDGVGAHNVGVNPWIGVISSVGRAVLGARCRPPSSQSHSSRD